LWSFAKQRKSAGKTAWPGLAFRRFSLRSFLEESVAKNGRSICAEMSEGRALGAGSDARTALKFDTTRAALRMRGNTCTFPHDPDEGDSTTFGRF
jgi:hypothetical protein